MSFSNDNSSLQNQLPLSVELSQNPAEMRYEINDLYQSLASSVNSKSGGLYVPQEKINSEQYFDATNTQKFKNVYRMVVDFGALPNAGSKSVAHNIPGITSDYRLTCSYGGATNPATRQWLPVPNDGILLENNSTTVTVTTTSDRSAFTATTIVIEYVKS